MLRGCDAIHIATVLEDCADQLHVLGKIMPVSYEDRSDAEQIVSGEIGQLVDTQRSLENKFQDVLGKKAALRGGGHAEKEQLSNTAREAVDVAGDLRNSTYTFARGLKQSPLTQDNLEKTQADRAFLQRVVQCTLQDLVRSGEFTSLVTAVKTEKDKKARLQDTILKEEEGRKRVKLLQKQLLEVKRDKEVEVQQRNEMIAHLKDQLQEMKAKTNMEGKYIKKCAEVTVAQTQKKCGLMEKELRDDADRLRQQIDEEVRVNAEIESYLRTHQTELEQKVDFWMEKYDKDVEQKQHELDVLKASKAKDLERLQELTKLYGEYEQVVVEDRIEKEKARRKAEQEAEELKSAVRIQAWFRGVMVRRGLGPYGKKKKKKGKKGKKSGKKKKK